MADPRATLLDAAQRLARCNSDQATVDQAARIMVAAWDLVTPERRAAFLNRIEYGAPYKFMRWRPKFPDMDPPDPVLEDAARLWPYIKKGLGGEDLQFAYSIDGLIHKRKSPSEKQAAWMKKIYNAWRATPQHEEPDQPVMEDDDDD